MAEKKPIYMKPWFWILAILVILVLWVMGTYNSLISLSVAIDNSWANVQAQYQRRYDLIPRLVNTTQAYAQFEKSTLTEITELRSRWQTTTDVNQRIQIAQQTDSAIARLLVVFENYPQLRTIEALRALQDELSGTENRIAVARMDYNRVVASYNAAIRYFPGNLIANIFGFTSKPYFAATGGAENAPNVPNTLT
jgi:LemA protein